jgi:hypothetical protein
VLGAVTIPPAARTILEADIAALTVAMIQRRITAPVVGRAVARALATGGENEGCKGGTPLPSSLAARNAQEGVACPTANFQGTSLPASSTADSTRNNGGAV